MLLEGATPGKPATLADLASWTSKYNVNYPAAVDPANKLQPLFEMDAYPINMIVNTKTMQLVKVLTGMPDAAFWTTFETTLGGGCM